MPNKHYVGDNLTSFSNNGDALPVSRVTLFVDSENAYTAGDDSGYEITADCAYATQEMADTLLKRLQNYKYRMFSASDGALDPAAELGDGITAGGVYGILAHINDDGNGYPSFDAPGKAELEDEYPMDGYLTQQYRQEMSRQSTTLRSEITKTAEEIRLEVSSTYSTKTELSDGLKESEESFTAKIEETAKSITSTVEGEISEKYTELSGKITNTETTLSSKIDQTAEHITSTVNKQIEETTTDLEGKISKSESDLRSEINQTAENITSTVEAVEKKTEELDGKITDTETTLSSKIDQTAAGIRSDVSANYVTTETLNGTVTQIEKNYSSAIDQRANSITTMVSETYITKDEFGDTTKSLRSSIEQNAGSIKTTIERVDALGTSYSSIEQTVDSITTRINDFNGKGSSIEETVDSITTNVSGLGGKYTKLEQTVEGFTFEDDEGKVWINNGNINLTGTISWEDLTSKVQGEINNRGISNSEAKTLINSTLVSSPNIAGGKFYALGAHTGELGDTWLEIGQDGSGWGGMILKDKDYYGENYEVFSIFNGDFMAGSMSWKGETFLTWNDTTGYTVPTSTWDFSNATVIWGTNAPYAVFQ